MKRIVSVGMIAASLALASSHAQPARGATLLAASWVVTYYLDPTGARGSQQCVNFYKKTASNGVKMGTWKSPTLPGWSGEWIQRGQHYQWHGSYVGPGGPTVVTYDVGDFVNDNITAETSVASLIVSNGVTSTNSSGTATMVQVPSCKGQPSHAAHPIDPLRGS